MATRPGSATDRYVAFWNADPTEARTLAPEVFADGVDYRSPAALMQGAEALIGFRTQFIGHVGPAVFAARREPEEHNDRIRLLWEIRLDDGTSFATGTDVLSLTGDGRIGSVSAFLDRPPEGFFDHPDRG